MGLLSFLGEKKENLLVRKDRRAQGYESFGRSKQTAWTMVHADRLAAERKEAIRQRHRDALRLKDEAAQAKRSAGDLKKQWNAARDQVAADKKALETARQRVKATGGAHGVERNAALQERKRAENALQASKKAADTAKATWKAADKQAKAKRDAHNTARKMGGFAVVPLTAVAALHQQSAPAGQEPRIVGLQSGVAVEGQQSPGRDRQPNAKPSWPGLPSIADIRNKMTLADSTVTDRAKDDASALEVA